MFKKNTIVDIGDRHFKLRKPVGSGGSGVVWLADEGEGQFAIKLINSNDSLKIQRFRNEIKFCRKFNHKNILTIVADGDFQDMPCYAMPYYSSTLKELISKEDDALKLMFYIMELGKALSFIHKKGMVHRDVKPENVLVDGNTLVLADFGICHFKDSGLTKNSDWLANRSYMAPEQKLRNNSKNVHQAADVYALGLIVNECFTKLNPAGSQFRLIANDYPLLSALDRLVENMIRQNPAERLTIEEVELELKYIRGHYREGFLRVKSLLGSKNRPLNISASLFKEAIARAAEDILVGKFLFATSSLREIGKYNRNWHMASGYKVDEFLYNLYVQESIHLICKSKFEYESNVYRADNWHHTLDLDNNAKHKELYEEMATILTKYKLPNRDEQILDLSGAILKYFASCADYHCREILISVKKAEQVAEDNLNCAPIIWIVYKLLYGINENKEYLLNGINGLGGSYEFDFSYHIDIDWQRTENFRKNDDDQTILDETYLEEQDFERRVLTTASDRWKMKFTLLNVDYYSVKFPSYRQYQKFRDFALAFSKADYVFEGDALDMISEPTFMSGMVELKVSRVFCIPNTLAKLVGLKEM